MHEIFFLLRLRSIPLESLQSSDLLAGFLEGKEKNGKREPGRGGVKKGDEGEGWKGRKEKEGPRKTISVCHTLSSSSGNVYPKSLLSSLH